MSSIGQLCPLAEEVNNFFENLTNASGILFHIHTHLKDYNKIYQKGAANKSFYKVMPILSTRLHIKDISDFENQSNKLPILDYGYSLYLDDIDNQLQVLESRIAMRELAYGYDIFETFLLDIISKFLFLNSKDYTAEIEMLFKKWNGNNQNEKTLENIRQSLTKLTRNGNIELFQLLRRLVPNLTIVEKSNTLGIDLQDWFVALTNVRHSIVHSNFIVKDRLRCKMTNQQLECIDKYFQPVYQEFGIELRMNYRFVLDNLDVIADYGLQIFKHLCIEKGYNWDIFNKRQK